MLNFSIVSEQYLSEKSVDVKLRCVIVEYFHSYIFIFICASINSPKASTAC